MVHTWLLKVSQSPDGRCFGKMAHSERRGDSVANIYGEQDIRIFQIWC